MKIHYLDLMNIKYPEKELEENFHLFNRYDWLDISWHQELSESFIEKYEDKVDWPWLSWRRKLSREFVQKHINKLNVDWLLLNEYVSDEIKEEIKIMKEII